MNPKTGGGTVMNEIEKIIGYGTKKICPINELWSWEWIVA